MFFHTPVYRHLVERIRKAYGGGEPEIKDESAGGGGYGDPRERDGGSNGSPRGHRLSSRGPKRSHSALTRWAPICVTEICA